MDIDPFLLAWSIFSDAALEPPEEAGMGGFLMGSYWHVPLWEGLQGLTIPVLEFLAGCVNLLVLHSMIGSPTYTGGVGEKTPGEKNTFLATFTSPL